MKIEYTKEELKEVKIEELTETSKQLLHLMLWTLKNAHSTLFIQNKEKKSFCLYVYKDLIVLEKDEKILWIPYFPLALGALHGYLVEQQNGLSVEGKGFQKLKMIEVNIEKENEIIEWLKKEKENGEKLELLFTDKCK